MRHIRDTHSSENLPRHYYEVLGRLLVAFQDLEQAVIYSLANLTRPKDHLNFELQYFLVLNELPFRSKVKLLRNFLETTTLEYFIWPGCPEEVKRREEVPRIILHLLEQARNCCDIEEQRNLMVHSTWEPEPSDTAQLARRFKIRVQPKKLSVTHETVKIEELEKLLEKMYCTITAISNISWLLISMLVEKNENHS